MGLQGPRRPASPVRSTRPCLLDNTRRSVSRRVSGPPRRAQLPLTRRLSAIYGLAIERIL